LDIKNSFKSWRAARKQKDEEPPSPAAPEKAVEAPAPVEPEIAAVIATVLAIEVKMFMALQGQRFTFRQDSPSQGWSDWGRLLVNPFQGVRQP
jgi:hypothetical protein